MPDCDLPPLLDSCEKGSLIVHLEGEDAVLVGRLEGGAVGCAVWVCLCWREGEAVER